MRTFLWVMLIMLVHDAILRLLWIAHDLYPRRTRGTTVADLIVGLILAGWVVHLLVAGEG